MPSQLLPIIAGVAGVVALGVIIFGILSVRSEKDLVEERLGRFEQDYQSFLEVEENNDDSPKEDKRALDQIDKAISKRPFAQKTRLQLARADIKLTVAEYFVLQALSPVAFFRCRLFHPV